MRNVDAETEKDNTCVLHCAHARTGDPKGLSNTEELRVY